MSDPGGLDAAPAGPRDRPGRGSASWLAAGIAAGALVAAGAVWLAPRVLGSDAPPAASGPPVLVEEASAAGLAHVYDGEFTFFVGGGVAVLDCDADGRPDVYLAGGDNPASLYRNVSTVGGALAFTLVDDPTPAMADVVGAYPIDVDGDRVTDLAVLRLGENVLLRGVGDCRFERANEAYAFDGGRDWTAAFSAKWEDGEDLPTLAFGNYLAIDETGEPTFDCADNVLFRPEAGGYSQPTPLSPGWCTLSVLFSDWDRSGRRDLRVANDRHYYRDGEEQLWRVVADEEPRLYTRDDGWKLMQIWGMGIASEDVTGDGLPEAFVTSQGDNKLQTLDEGATGPSYSDIAIRRGVTAHRPFLAGAVLPSTAWHPEFDDVNNDGFVDLYISKGNVEAQTDHAVEDPSDLLLGQPDGTFVEAAADAGLMSLGRSRGAAVVDFNLDGLLDIIEVNRRENVKLWRNVGAGSAAGPEPMGNWIALDLRQSGPNVDAVGAWVTVRVGDRIIERELTIGGGHAGGQLTWMHVGVGSAREVDVSVQWPDGEIGPWHAVETNSFLIVERGADAPRRWEPAAP